MSAVCVTRVRTRLSLLLLLAAASFVALVAKDAVGVEPASAPDEGRLPELIDLEMIRAQVGSPTDGSIFARDDAGASDEKSAELNFDEAYHRVATRMPNLDPAELTLSREADEIGSTGEREMVDALRSTARLLETTAWSNEDAGDFAKADRLRRLAKRLRHEAREVMVGVAD